MGKTMLELLKLKDEGKISPLQDDGIAPPPTFKREQIIPSQWGDTVKTYIDTKIKNNDIKNAIWVQQILFHNC
mgnify:CR=1 FL=1